MTETWAIVIAATAFVFVEALVVMGLGRVLGVGRTGYGFAIVATAAWSLLVALAAQLDGMSSAWVQAAALFLGAVFFGLVLKTSLLKGLAFSIVAAISVMAIAGANHIYVRDFVAA